MKRNRLTVLIALTALLGLAACSTTRRLPEGELLYTGTRPIKFEMPEGAGSAFRVPDELRTSLLDAVDMAPNNYLSMLRWRYPFPLGLWVYNNWPDSAGGLGGWLYKALVAQPVLVSEVQPELRAKVLKQMLDNNGYFRARTGYELVHPRNKRKAAVQYVVNAGPVFTIDTVETPVDSTRLLGLIDSIAARDTYLRRGSAFALDSLEAARTRITNVLRNRGYYFFRPDYIEYLADSTIHPGSIALRLDMADNVPWWALNSYTTGTITVVMHRYEGAGTPDTISMDRGITLVEMQPLRLRRQLVPECVRFRRGRTFSVRDMNRTQANLARLGIFRDINISAIPDTAASEPTLNVTVDCRFDAPLEAMIEANASSKSNSYLGPGLQVGITNRNLFGGGEQLSMQLTGAYEWQTGGGSRGSVFNSYEAGISTSLAFPRLLAPKFIPRSRYQLNWTRFQLAADLLNRPHYFKMAQFNASMSYDWRWRRHVSNSFTPLRLTYTNLMRTTAEFDSIMAANPAVAQSFQSQFVPQMIYSYTYDRQIDRDNAVNVQLTAQEAGNVFWGLWRIAGVKGEKKLFGTPFSQFVKGQGQVVWNRRLKTGHYLVSRVAVGAEHAYGNSTQVPYSEQFYVGGANSVRAFTVRSIGPGSYRPAPGTPEDYFDRTGTFKFEANVEYRFPIAGPLAGAVFFDSGNVWLLRPEATRPGGELKASTFLRDLATGTGAGLRFDIEMLVLRADLGVGIHAPYDTGRKGYYNMPSLRRSLAFHLAIGYPF